MRSRTELVTTTFDLDSDEEDYSPDDDDSEEDWRPTNKRRQQKTQTRANCNSGGDGGAPAGVGVGRKRKQVAASTAFKAKKRALANKVSDEDFGSADDNDDDPDSAADGSDEDDDSLPATSSSKRLQNLPPKKQFNTKLSQLDLLLNKRDLYDKDWMQNSRLCLWRKDEKTNLLQKYLRVKTTADEENPGAEQQLLFTSSSVVNARPEVTINIYSIILIVVAVFQLG